MSPEENQDIEEKISKAFSSIERNSVKNKFVNFSPVKEEVFRYEEKLDVNQCKMVMAFKSHNKDTYAMKLMNTIFGGTPFSKLFLNVREKLSLCYYSAAGYNQLKGTDYVECGIE